MQPIPPAPVRPHRLQTGLPREKSRRIVHRPLLVRGQKAVGANQVCLPLPYPSPLGGPKPTLTHAYPALPTLTRPYPRLPTLTRPYPRLPDSVPPPITSKPASRSRRNAKSPPGPASRSKRLAKSPPGPASRSRLVAKSSLRPASHSKNVSTSPPGPASR